MLVDLKTSLKELKSSIIKLRKYPGNTTYINKYNTVMIAMQKKSNVLIQKIKNTDIENMQALEKQLIILRTTTCLIKDKSKALKEIDNVLNQIEINDTQTLVTSTYFSDELEKLLLENCKSEVDDLKLVYGKSGDCTAFLLRKILEKTLYIVLIKNKFEKNIERQNGSIKSLTDLLKIVRNEKINNKHIMMPKTVQKIQGIKYLGDSAAHNYLINIDMEDIKSQMPFITTALREILSH
jgi:hypothetical protein